MSMPALQVVGGLVLLVLGAEVLVRGASAIAARHGVPPIIIGLTIVAFGTSAPELTVSVLSASRGESSIAVGNVLGSNIFNVLVILGLAALVRPLAINARVVWRDVPVMLGVSAVSWLLASNGTLSRSDGLLLVLGLGAFVWSMRSSGETAESSGTSGRGGLWAHTLFVVAGLAALVLGSHWLVEGATSLARALGVSELAIGLTLVASGTSLPELATSLVAAYRNERDIAVGNVVGSNVFNLLGVLGTASVMASSPISVMRTTLAVDFPVLVTSAALCLVFFHSGRRLSRLEGALMVGGYLAYLAYTILARG